MNGIAEPRDVCTEPVAKLTTNQVKIDYRKSTEHGKLATEYKESCAAKIDLSTDYNGKPVCLPVLNFTVIGQFTIKIPEIFQVFTVF